MVSAPEIPAREALSPAQAEALFAILEADGSVIQAARAHAIAPADLLALIDHPAALRALDSLREIAALRRDLRADTLRDEFITILRDVARNSPDLGEKRRAATTALRALGFRSASARTATARRSPVPRVVAHAPPDHSAPRPRASHRHAASTAATAGMGGEDPSSVHRPNGATGCSRGWSAVAEGDGAEPVVSVPTGTAPQGAEEAPPANHVRDDSAAADPLASLLRLDENHSAFVPQSSTLPTDPDGTLAIARHVLDAVAIDPHAYPPDAIDAARAYIQFCDQQIEHPARPP